MVPELKNDSNNFELRIETLEHWEILESLESNQFNSQFAKGELKLEVVEDNGSDLKIRSHEFTTDIVTGEVIWDTEKTVTVDRHSRKSIDWDSFFIFPLDTQKQDYKFGIFGDKPHHFSFEKSIAEHDFTIYEFSTTDTYDISGAYEKFPDEKILADQTTFYEVEPTTGQIVNYRTFWQDYSEINGERIIISNGNAETSEYSRDIQLDKVRHMISLYNIYDNVIPLFIIISMVILTLLVYISQSYVRKQSEVKQKEKEKFELIGHLSSNLAHDIRTPLSNMRTSVEMINHERGNDHFIKTLNDNVLKNIKKIDYQIEGILEFIKKPKVHLQNSSFMEILDSSIKSLKIPSKIRIEKPTNDIQFSCDPLKIEVLLTNLLLNAIQAINKDSGEIKIRCSENENLVKIEIENSGPNIPKEHLKKIFDPLFTTKQEGTGLGLLSCKNIVEVHKGKLYVKNNPVVFTIEIPKISIETKSNKISKEIQNQVGGIKND